MTIATREVPHALPMQTRAAQIAPGSINAEARTVDVVFTTGATVRRRKYVGWDTVPFDETLEVSERAINLKRLNAGAPVLDSHSAYSSYSQVGVVERAWIEGSKGMATIRFPSAGVDEAADRMFGLVAEGIIKNISAGYTIDKARVVEPEKKGAVEQLIVERWTPMEISFVTVPADPGAQVRSDDTATYPIDVTVTRSATGEEPSAPVADNQETRHMGDEAPASPQTPAVTPAPAAPQVDAAAMQRAATEAAEAAVRADRERAANIREIAGKLNMRDFGDQHATAGTGVDEFRRLLVDEMARRSEAQPQTFSAAPVHVYGAVEPAKRAAAIENALLNRAYPATVQLTEDGRDFRGYSLMELCRSHLEANGTSTRGMSKMDVARLALEVRSGGLHSTSDFPNILSNVASKTLRDAYAEAPQTFRPLVRIGSVPDFKEVTRLQISNAPDLKQVTEGGEIERGSLSEAKEGFKISTFSRIVGITRQNIVNDDLDALTRLPTSFGRQVAQLESDLAWGQILGNPTMGDGVALFHANHGNLGTAAAISAASVGAARLAMSLQKGLEGNVLNISPTYFIVPGALMTVVEQFLGQIYAAKTADAVPNSMRQLQIISDPRLDSGIARLGISGSSTAWYLAASPASTDLVELAYLDGNQTPYFETRTGFDVDGVELKCRHDVGAKVLDWRGLYKNPYAG